MKSSYHSLTVSIAQARDWGLEEAALFHCLVECSARAGGASDSGTERWYSAPQSDIVSALPFWDAAQLQKIARRLCDRGVIQCAFEPTDRNWRFCFSQAPPAPAPGGGLRPLPADWRPSAEALAELRRHHGVDEAFALGELDAFKVYCQERGEKAYSWNNRFRDQVLRRWRERRQHREMRGGWRPGKYVLDELNRLGVSAEFIEEAIPEFTVYWMEKDRNAGTWDSKFIKHIKEQWRRYQAELQSGGAPSAMRPDWRPSQELRNMLQLARIPLSFAEERIPEFIFYWRERGAVMPAWNALFFRHVRREWARERSLQTKSDSRSWRDFVDAHTDLPGAMPAELQPPAQNAAPLQALEDAIDRIFAEYALLFPPQFRKSFPSQEHIQAVKKLWRGFFRRYDAGLLLQAAREAARNARYLPTHYEVDRQCARQAGLPELEQAWREACDATPPLELWNWSHPAVCLAAQLCGTALHEESRNAAFRCSADTMKICAGAPWKAPHCVCPKSCRRRRSRPHCRRRRPGGGWAEMRKKLRL